jgi:predicted lactoylglutathione lyase
MKQIFINLPVKNLNKSMEFYSQIGFVEYPLFTFDDQKCMAWGEQILVMLHSKEFFNSGNKKPIDSKKYLTPSFTLPVENLEEVNKLIESGIKAGGKEPNPMLDEGFMQVRTIEDLDGYIWGIIYLDLAKFKAFKTAN